MLQSVALFIFTLFFPPLHILEFQWLRQPSTAVSILNSGSVSPAGERICKTKHVFLLPAAKRDRFSQAKWGSASQHITSHSRNLPLVMARRGAFAAALGAGGRGEEEEEEESSRSEHLLRRTGEQELNGERGKREQRVAINAWVLSGARSQMTRSKVWQSCSTGKVDLLLF